MSEAGDGGTTRGADEALLNPADAVDSTIGDGMRLLFVDNRDSFVWNLVDGFSVLGADTLLEPNTVTLEEVREMDLDAVVISPGPGTPYEERDIGNCIEIIRETEVPLLGVCLGLQAAAVAFGGTVAPSESGPVHGKSTEVEFDPEEELFRGVEGPVRAGRYHSLVVQDPGDLEVIARDPRGEIMAAKHPGRPIYGLQFHPESVLTPDGPKVMENFLRIAKELSAEDEKRV